MRYRKLRVANADVSVSPGGYAVAVGGLSLTLVSFAECFALPATFVPWERLQLRTWFLSTHPHLNPWRVITVRSIIWPDSVRSLHPSPQMLSMRLWFCGFPIHVRTPSWAKATPLPQWTPWQVLLCGMLFVWTQSVLSAPAPKCLARGVAFAASRFRYGHQARQRLPPPLPQLTPR